MVFFKHYRFIAVFVTAAGIGYVVTSITAYSYFVLQQYLILKIWSNKT